MAKSKQKYENKLLLFIKEHLLVVLISFILLISLVFVLFVFNKETNVMSVGNYNFSKEDYYMYLLSNKYAINDGKVKHYTKKELKSNYKDDLTLEEYLSQKTVNELKIAGIVRIMSSENEIELSNKDKQELQEEKDNFIESLGGRNKYKKLLSDNNTNEKAYDKMAETDKLYDQLINNLYSKGKVNDISNDIKDEAKEEYYNTYYKVKELIISKVDLTNDEMLSTKEINQKRELANSLCDKANNNYDFDSLIKLYSDGITNELYITEDNIEEDVYEIVKELDIDEVSSVIEKSKSFYILKRVELDEKELDNFYNTKRDNALLTDIASYEEKVKIKYSKEFYKLKVY